MLTVRPAAASEAARVMEIIEDGRRTIARLGIEQWQHGYPDLAAIERDIANGSCYVAEDESGALVGTLALLFARDTDYTAATEVPWITEDSPACAQPPYAAIHRCAVAASATSRGVMSFMFKQAESIALAAGRSSIRIDTHPGNRNMRGFLTHCGFTELAAFNLVSHADVDPVRIAYEKLIKSH